MTVCTRNLVGGCTVYYSPRLSKYLQFYLRFKLAAITGISLLPMFSTVVLDLASQMPARKGC